MLVPCGAVIDARGVEAGIRQLRAEPGLAALVDLPVPEPAAGILLDLLLQPDEVRAVLCRREVLQACVPPLQLEGTLACARGALQIACGQEIVYLFLRALALRVRR